MKYDLRKTILKLDEIDARETGSIIVPDGFCTAGFWALIAALAHERQYSYDDIILANDDQKTYCRALDMEGAVTGSSGESISRPNLGRTYSPLVKIDSADATDRATSTINSCLRSMCPEGREKEGFRSLCDVIGEVHSNVWDHGLRTGFSIAQKSKVPHKDDFYFEFALVDRGCGFKKEMERVGNKDVTDKSAIEWCIKEGNTTKSTTNRDEFAQRVPLDLSGISPYGINVEAYASDGDENHHQGLGLAKLVKLITSFNGELSIASGNVVFTINALGVYTFTDSNNNWDGVALSCRLLESKLLAESEEPTQEIEFIMEALRSHDNEN